LLGVGAVAIYGWARRTWASPYYAACRLDVVAGLDDRMSTALCFGNAANPNQMLLRQREDALSRVPQIDVASLFPIRTPALAGRALLLALLAAGMFAYRVHHQPPMMALLRASARSHLLQTALTNRDAAEDPREIDSTPKDSLTKTADVDDAAQQDVQGGPASAKADATPAKGESLVESLLETVKGMASGDGGQDQPANGENKQQSAHNDSPPSSDSAQPDPSSGGTQDESQNKSDGQHASSGAGDKLRDPQPMAKNILKSTDPSVKAVPDRVALPSANINDQPRTRSSADTGASQMAVRDVSPRAMAAINGGEQNDIPARYRVYLQRYFEHDDAKKK